MTEITDQQLKAIEGQYATGLTSAELLELCVRLNVSLSEANLRKYVQLGLLARSVRVGRKGKHQGSQGVYPVSVLRQVLRIKEMMADNYTIEQIQRDFFFMRRDLQLLEETLSGIFSTLAQLVQQRARSSYAQDVGRDIDGAKRASNELLSRLEGIELRLTTRARLQRLSAS
ncbi:MAG: hypothetical protein RJA70_1628 [Pseudomonadota bacterium]|jgi:hypothetical protein